VPLPKVAFHNPPLRARPPSYGYDDGFAVRFTDDEVWACYADGKWREISKTESLYKVGVLTERDYLRMYGPTGRRPVPPLPDNAFCSGWRSPLLQFPKAKIAPRCRCVKFLCEAQLATKTNRPTSDACGTRCHSWLVVCWFGL